MGFKLPSVWIQVCRQPHPDTGGWSCSSTWRHQQAPTQTMLLHTSPDPRCLPSNAGQRSVDLKHKQSWADLTIWGIMNGHLLLHCISIILAFPTDIWKHSKTMWASAGYQHAVCGTLQCTEPFIQVTVEGPGSSHTRQWERMLYIEWAKQSLQDSAWNTLHMCTSTVWWSINVGLRAYLGWSTESYQAERGKSSQPPLWLTLIQETKKHCSSETLSNERLQSWKAHLELMWGVFWFTLYAQQRHI